MDVQNQNSSEYSFEISKNIHSIAEKKRFFKPKLKLYFIVYFIMNILFYYSQATLKQFKYLHRPFRTSDVHHIRPINQTQIYKFERNFSIRFLQSNKFSFKQF